MILLHEKALFHGETLEVELHDDLTYRLRFGDKVRYENHSKFIGNKQVPYEFRSVEQLRYDFERDVAAVGGSLG
jgi:hypothetical protein